MAKMSSEERMRLREEIGLDTSSVEVQREVPKQRVTLSGDAINELRNPTEEQEKRGWGEITADAFAVDNTSTQISRAGGVGSIYEGKQFPLDPNFNPRQFAADNKDRVLAMTGIDIEEALENLSAARSQEEAENELQVMERVYQIEGNLAKDGARAIAPRLLAAMADPVDIGLTAAGGYLGAAAKVGRLGKIVTGGLVAAGAAGGTEALLARNNPFRDEYDVAFATLAGFTLGSGFGALASKSDIDQISDLANREANEILDRAADSAGARRVSQASDEELDRIDIDSEKTLDEVLDDIESPDFNPKDKRGGLGALISKMTFSPGNRLRNSPLEDVRKLASRMFEGGLTRGVREFTAELRAARYHSNFMGAVAAASDPFFKSWARRNGYTNLRRAGTTQPADEFYSEVGRALRGDVDGLSQEATQAAQHIRKHLDAVHARAQRAGVKGFENGGLEDYFPRVIKHHVFQEKLLRYGDKRLADWFRESIIRANDDISEEVATRISRAYVHLMRVKGAGLEHDLLHGIRIDDIPRLRAVFKDYEDLNELINAVESIKLKETAEKGGVSYGKRRIKFDETYDGYIRTLDGVDEQLNFHEMFENNALKVLGRYSRSMNGHIGMAEALGIKSRDEFDEWLRGLASKHEGRITQDDLDEIVSDLQFGYDMVLGINRMDDGSTRGSRFARTMTGINHILMGTQFGVAAIAELGNTIGKIGLTGLIRAIPEFRRIAQRAADGQLDYDLARSLETLYSPGVHTLTGLPVRGMDELADTLVSASKTDPYVRSGMRLTNLFSGLTAVTDWTQRLHSVTMTRRLAEVGSGTKKFRAGERNRMEGLGWSREMQDRITKLLREDGAGRYENGRFMDIDIDKARELDPEALEAFSLGMKREVRQAIQETDATGVPKVFHTPHGKMMFQFMSFPWQAIEKQTARMAHYADVEAGRTIMATLFITANAYIGQTYIQYANNPEQLKKRLTVENIAKAAFMRSGFASMFPAFYDFGASAVGAPRQFSFGRQSGLETGLPWVSNPSMATVGNVAKTTAAIGSSIFSDERQIAQQDINTAFKLVPFQRLLGAQNVATFIAEQFPESKKE